MDLNIASKRKLLSVVDKCALAARIVRRGRAFLSRFLSANLILHLHHTIRLYHEARADLKWWIRCIELPMLVVWVLVPFAMMNGLQYLIQVVSILWLLDISTGNAVCVCVCD